MFPDKIVDEAKKLPGVTYVLAAVTYLGARATGAEELAGLPLVIACALCAFGYWVGSKLDRPLYDSFYEHGRGYAWLPKHVQLREARDTLAAKLYSSNAVKNYQDLVTKKLLPDDINLYTIAKKAAEGGKKWDGRISYAHDISKAARSLLVISAVMLVILLVTAAFPEAVPPWLSVAIHRLGFWWHPAIYVVLLPVFLFAYFYLRALHQVALYEVTAENVQVLPLPKGDAVAVIPEVTLYGARGMS